MIFNSKSMGDPIGMLNWWVKSSWISTSSRSTNATCEHQTLIKRISSLQLLLLGLVSTNNDDFSLFVTEATLKCYGGLQTRELGICQMILDLLAKGPP